MKHDNHDSLRHDMAHVGPHDVFDDLLGQSLGQVLVQRVHEAVGVEPRFVRADEHGQILGHLTAFNGVDDDLLQRLGEVTGVPSRSARCLRPPVHAKMEAIGLVEVFSPFCQRR